MKLPELLDVDQLAKLVEDKYITLRKHGRLPLTVANYSPKTMWEQYWIHETRVCRGLIYDTDHNIVARPFEKFMNYGQVRLPSVTATKKPVITAKLDGSLGVYCKYDGQTLIATRGSFESEMAIWATDLWETKYAEVQVPEGVTPLFEIIYQGSRVVCEYDFEDIVLIAVIDNETGADVPLYEAQNWWPGRKAKQHWDIDTLEAAYTAATGKEYDNEEGVVVTWYQWKQPSFRLKIKHPDYLSLHKLYTGTSTTSIWEALSTGLLEDRIATMPDELYSWVKETAADIKEVHDSYIAAANREFENIGAYVSRKEFASKATGSEYSAALFKLYDGRPIDDIAWKMAKPAYSKPFKVDEA